MYVLLKRIFSYLLVFSIVFSLCSCGNDTAIVETYKLPDRIAATKSATISQADKYTLDWDLDKKCLILYDNNEGALSSVPYSVYLNDDGTAHSSLYASIAISYIEPKLGSLMDANSKDDAENNGYIEAKKIEDGVRLTYYFNGIGISVPVEYTLSKNGLSASVIVSGIKESENKLYSVSLLPYMASTENNENSYIVVPSGSGAIMYADGDMRSTRTYSEPVFGADAANPAVYENTVTNSVRLPVFGIKDSFRFTMGIIESGAENAYIEAVAGDTATGYSYVYAKFCVRGFAESYVKDVNGGNMSIKKFSDIISTPKLTVTYKTMSLDASYIDMAEEYRRYLIGEKADTDKVVPDLILDFYGAAEIDNSFVGIPYKSLETITTFKDVKDILCDITENNSEINIIASLKGFGSDGLDFGELAGGFKLNKNSGNSNAFKELLGFTEESDILLSVDFDTVYFNKSSNGFSAKFDVAKNANSTAIVKSRYSIVTHARDTDRTSSKLVSRDEFDSISENLNKFIKKYSINAVSLSTISNVAYSDYSNKEYYNKSNMAKDVSKLIKSVKDENIIITKNANSYAAVLSDYIMDAPTASSGYRYLDGDIPFYQIVFRGYIPYSSAAINLASNPETEFLKAVSTGSALYFTVGAKFDERFIRSVNDAIGASIYDGISEMIFNYANEYKPFLEKIGNSRIVDYSVQEDLIYTTYENGIISCVNLGYDEAVSEIGKVSARGFTYKQ